MARKISPEKARWVLALLQKQYPHEEFIDGPFLKEGPEEEWPEGHWGIAWEGGPEDWVHSFQPNVVGVFVEPSNHWLLHLIPTD